MVDVAHHKSELARWGITRIEGLIPKTEVLKSRDQVRNVAITHGWFESGRWRTATSRFSLDKSFRDDLKALTRSHDFPDLLSGAVRDLAECLTGEPVKLLPPGQQILFTLPNREAWSVPHDVWHVDAPRLGTLGPPGLQAFICLDDVVPQGGGTLVIAGSHRLLNTPDVMRSRDIKRALNKEDYFKWLFDTKRAAITCIEDTQGRVGDVALEVVELTGRAGDVYLMDLRALHTPAQNASGKARIMLTCRLPRATVAPKLIGS